MGKEKVVTNLLLEIGKARDILETRDLELIYRSLFFLNGMPEKIQRQMCKYIKEESHELDFNFEDVKAMSDEAYEVVKNMQQTFSCDRYIKEFDKMPQNDDSFTQISYDIKKRADIDYYLREFYKRLAYMAFTIRMWSQTDYKLSFMDQLAAHIRTLR